MPTPVVTYQLAYTPHESVDLCAECYARGDHELGSIGPVQHGAHDGTCDSPTHEAGGMRITGQHLRDVTGWDAVDFVRDHDRVTVHIRYGTLGLEASVLWCDARGVAQDLGDIEASQIPDLFSTYVHAGDIVCGGRLGTDEFDVGEVTNLDAPDNDVWVAWSGGNTERHDVSELRIVARATDSAGVRVQARDACWARDRAARESRVG